MDIYDPLSDVMEYCKEHNVMITINKNMIKAHFTDQNGKVSTVFQDRGNLNKVVSALPHNF